MSGSKTFSSEIVNGKGVGGDSNTIPRTSHSSSKLAAQSMGNINLVSDKNYTSVDSLEKGRNSLGRKATKDGKKTSNQNINQRKSSLSANRSEPSLAPRSPSKEATNNILGDKADTLPRREAKKSSNAIDMIKLQDQRSSLRINQTKTSSSQNDLSTKKGSNAAYDAIRAYQEKNGKGSEQVASSQDSLNSSAKNSVKNSAKNSALDLKAGAPIASESSLARLGRHFSKVTEEQVQKEPWPENSEPEQRVTTTQKQPSENTRDPLLKSNSFRNGRFDSSASQASTMGYSPHSASPMSTTGPQKSTRAEEMMAKLRSGASIKVAGTSQQTMAEARSMSGLITPVNAPSTIYEAHGSPKPRDGLERMSSRIGSFNTNNSPAAVALRKESVARNRNQPEVTSNPRLSEIQTEEKSGSVSTAAIRPLSLKMTTSRGLSFMNSPSPLSANPTNAMLGPFSQSATFLPLAANTNTTSVSNMSPFARASSHSLIDSQLDTPVKKPMALKAMYDDVKYDKDYEFDADTNIFTVKGNIHLVQCFPDGGSPFQLNPGWETECNY